MLRVNETNNTVKRMPTVVPIFFWNDNEVIYIDLIWVQIIEAQNVRTILLFCLVPDSALKMNETGLMSVMPSRIHLLNSTHNRKSVVIFFFIDAPRTSFFPLLRKK